MDHLLSIADLSPEDIEQLLQSAAELKSEWREGRPRQLLRGVVLGMIFQKPSLRTRVSFEVGMLQLGGHALYLSPQEVQLGQRESVPDVARVLSRYMDGVMARVFEHSHLEELARYATVPVINGLSDLCHPCQALSDLFTLWERRGKLRGLQLAYLGDGNNVAHSLLLATTKMGMHIALASPPGFEAKPQVLARALGFARASGSRVQLLEDPREAVRGADVIYTDVWTSMGQESEREQRLKIFSPYQLNAELLSAAADGVLVMHCLPAHRGEEITSEVLDGPHSIVFDQAENRLHLQKAILVRLLAPSATKQRGQ